jgi:hypothetical protein
MVQTAMQYTPAQVLQAARRAEAEGKMDYALQFYRHLVEQHGATPEAQEAREGLFRIAEWRWGEARIARRQEGAPAGQFALGAAAANPPQPPKFNEPPAPSAFAGSAPQAVSRETAGDEFVPLFKLRYRVAKVIAYSVSTLGLLSGLAGIALVALGFGGSVEPIAAVGAFGFKAAVGAFGFPMGLVLGVPTLLLGVVLLLAGQLAVAVFDIANANLEIAAIERGRASF